MMKKRLIAALLAGAMLLSGTTALAADPVADTAADTAAADAPWYAKPMQYAAENGYLRADVRPDASMNRETVADMLYRISLSLGIDFSYATSDLTLLALFRQLSDGSHVSPEKGDAVWFCFATGIMSGNGDGTLRPQSPVTREELAVLLQRFTRVIEQHLPTKNIASPTAATGEEVRAFSDFGAFGTWSYSGVSFCAAGKLMGGNADGTFHPKGGVTNAEMAQIIYNYLETYLPETQVAKLDTIDLSSYTRSAWYAATQENRRAAAMALTMRSLRAQGMSDAEAYRSMRATDADVMVDLITKNFETAKNQTLQTMFEAAVPPAVADE